MSTRPHFSEDSNFQGSVLFLLTFQKVMAFLVPSLHTAEPGGIMYLKFFDGLGKWIACHYFLSFG
jgi:hypothetical protein